MKRYSQTLKILLAALALAGCDKSGTVECEYIVTTYFQEEEKGAVELASQPAGYLFYADTTDFLPADYQQAAAGKISARRGGGTLDFDMRAVADQSGALVFSPITRKGVMLVVCCPATRSWAVRQAPIEGGIPRITASVTFRAWQQNSPYLDSRWEVWNQSPPVRVDTDIAVSVVSQAGSGAPALPAAGVVGHAFAADTALWKVASLADALEGKLTSTANVGQTLAPQVTAVVGAHTGELLFEGIAQRKTVLVVADQASRRYAVRQFRLDYGQAPIAERLDIPWSEEWPTYSADWKIYHEAPPEPQNPEEPEDRD